MKYVENVLQLIGSTPLLKLQSLAENIQPTILLKLESANPGGSVKDRIGIAMLEAAERDGKIKPGDLLIEPTSGNTGIGLALAARLKGYRCLFVMTDKASQERVRYLKALGADVLIVSSAAKSTSPEYYFNTALRLAAELPNAIMLNQYDNPANPAAHEVGTGPEIWEATEGKITHFVSGIGTGGTITGTARFLKKENPNIKIIAADPTGSSIKTFKDTGRLVEALPYLIEGVGQERIPGNLDLNLIDDIVNISDKEAFQTARQLVREEGIFCGGSSGMNVAAALKIAKVLPADAVIVAIICDTGERYLTKHHSDEWLKEKQLIDLEKATLRMAMSEKISKAATPAIVTISPEMTVRDVLALMSKHEISEIPVVASDKAVGAARENRLMAQVIEDRAVLDYPIEKCMSEPMPILSAQTDIQTGIQVLKEHPAIMVEDFGRFVGILSRHDVLQYI